MSPRLRRLSGDEVVQALTRFGFLVRSTKGSHVKLQRLGADGTRETLVVPRHAELDTGTLRAIFRQASRYVPEGEPRPIFFSAVPAAE
jgi:predicted RNA binding protein YcfA (HicA-like mRNA interferase family)